MCSGVRGAGYALRGVAWKVEGGKVRGYEVGKLESI